MEESSWIFAQGELRLREGRVLEVSEHELYPDHVRRCTGHPPADERPHSLIESWFSAVSWSVRAARLGWRRKKVSREISEQHRVNELGGIKELENKVNPIGPKRQHLMDKPPDESK